MWGYTPTLEAGLAWGFWPAWRARTGAGAPVPAVPSEQAYSVVWRGRTGPPGPSVPCSRVVGGGPGGYPPREGGHQPPWGAGGRLLREELAPFGGRRRLPWGRRIQPPLAAGDDGYSGGRKGPFGALTATLREEGPLWGPDGYLGRYPSGYPYGYLPTGTLAGTLAGTLTGTLEGSPLVRARFSRKGP